MISNWNSLTVGNWPLILSPHDYTQQHILKVKSICISRLQLRGNGLCKRMRGYIAKKRLNPHVFERDGSS